MEKYKDMKSIFCIAFLILLLPFISCNYKVTHQYSSSTLKEIEKQIDYIDYNKIDPNKKIILTQIQDISDEVKKLVGINQNITSFSFNSFIDNQHLYTITDQGIFFKTNLESNTRKSYNIPEWIGWVSSTISDIMVR